MTFDDRTFSLFTIQQAVHMALYPKPFKIAWHMSNKLCTIKSDCSNRSSA